MESAPPTPLVSVIIPIYNAEEYLRETLDCVCAQTLREIEIICVDDGSTDGTPAILAEYAARDPRFVLLRQQNKFAGAARNYGMTVARGKYISFLDSDDLFAPDMFECMAGAAEKWQADMVHCMGCEYYPQTGETKPMPHLIAPELMEQHHGPINLRQMLGNRIFQRIGAATWNKLYLSSFLHKHALDWPNALFGEDMGFVLLACYLSECSVLLPEEFVRYRIRSSSLSHNQSLDFATHLSSFEILHNRLVSKNAQNDTMRSFDNFFWECTWGWFLPRASMDSHEALRKDYPALDEKVFHIMDRPRQYFYKQNVYERMHAFFRPTISFIVTHAPLWCMERKLESMFGMPFNDYEILLAVPATDVELMQIIKGKFPLNPSMRIVSCSTGGDAEAACRHAARGRILMHLPGNLKLRTGIAPALRELVKSPVQGDVPALPYCTSQTRRELFYRCRSNMRSFCLFGKPFLSIVYTEREKTYWFMGARIWRSMNQ